MQGYILIVENELDIADVMRRYLDFEGFATLCVTQVEDARVACAKHRPDMIVVDWHLPDIEGDQWVAELRACPDTADIPIVMMTGGYPTPALLAQLASARIPLLIKPFSLDMLVEHIRHVVGRERMLGAA